MVIDMEPTPEQTEIVPPEAASGTIQAAIQIQTAVPIQAVVPIQAAVPKGNTNTAIRKTGHSASPIALTAGRKSAAILFSVLILVFSIAIIALAIVRPHNIRTAIMEADVSMIVDQTGLNDVIVNSIAKSPFQYINVDIESIDYFIRRKNVREEISKVVEKYASAITNGDFDYHITPREITDFLKAIAPDIRDEFEYRFTSNDYKQITDSLIFNETLKDYGVGKVLGVAGIDAVALYVLFSIYPLLVAAILFATLIFDIFLLHRKKVRNAFLNIGIPLAFSGVIVAGGSLMFGPLSKLLNSSGLYLVANAVGGYINLAFFAGLICLGAGIVAIMAYYIVAKVLKKQLPFKTTYDKASKAWLNAGIITNIAALIACSAVMLICFWGLR